MKKINTDFIVAILLGLVLTISISTILFSSSHRIQGADNGEPLITHLNFDLALLMIIMISALILIISTIEKRKK